MYTRKSSKAVVRKENTRQRITPKKRINSHQQGRSTTRVSTSRQKSSRQRITSRRFRHNGLKSFIPENAYNYLGCGSYGSIFNVRKSHVAFKLHNISSNDQDDKQCIKWEHEFNIQKDIYNLCNYELNQVNVYVVKPFRFVYSDKRNDGIQCLLGAQNATSCLFTMKRVQHGPKWNHLLKSPIVKTNIPPYLFLGTVYPTQDTTQITLANMIGSKIRDMPNDAITFCEDPGNIAVQTMESMIAAFFILLKHGFMPRDIEYVADGDPQTLMNIAILDFNEVMTIVQRKEKYNENGDFGYSKELDAAHVYIDLCGIRSGSTRNPMASYDFPTPQWKFLCNPLTCPSAFLQLFAVPGRRDLGEIILEYAWRHRMQQRCENISDKLHNWKPLFVYQIDLGTPVPPDTYLIGTFTESDYQQYRTSLCAFFDNKMILPSQKSNDVYAYVASMKLQNDLTHPRSVDRFVEFDIQFQHYILSYMDAFLETTSDISKKSFQDLLNDAQSSWNSRVYVDDGFPSFLF